MKTIWLKDVKTEDQEKERRMWVVSAVNAFSILTGILEDKIRIKEGERNSPKNYELPAYSEYQADVSGYIRALREVQSLINLKE
jgi:hypothetical protein